MKRATLRMPPAALILLGLWLPLAPAVTPATWNHASEADFTPGKFASAVVTSHGELMLARDVKCLLKSQDAPPVVTAVAAAGNAIYAGSGSKGEIYKIEGGKAAMWAQLPSTTVCSLLATDKGLLAGGGGDKGGVYRVDADGKATLLWSDPKVKYVWAMVLGTEGIIYAATGPEGGVYAIQGNRSELIYQVPQKLARNILCLAAGKDRLYAGTDASGLVIEIDPLAKTGRVILDAEEKEVSAIVVDASGAVFAATSDASKAGDGLGRPMTEKVGKGGLMTAPAVTSMPTSDPFQPSTAGAATDAAGPSAVNSGPNGKPASNAAAASGVADEDPVADEVVSDEGAGADESEEADAEATPSHGLSAGASRGATPPGGDFSAGKGPGNSVYCIQKDGLVSMIFHRPVTVLAMMPSKGRLLLATGNDGTIYSISTDGDDVSPLARTEARQVTSLAQMPDGNIVLGTANKGSVAMIGQDFAKEGTFTSKPLDARQIARWGTLQVAAKAPEGAAVLVSTRSGNVSEPDDKTWGAWSKEQPVSNDYPAIASPAGRFLQYRIRMTSKGQATPVVTRLTAVYQVGNLAPQLTAVTVQALAKDGQMFASRPGRGGAAPGGETEEKSPRCMRQAAIRCADPNNDQLIFAIYFRQAGEANWVKIADKLRDSQYLWDTRTVADGTYELKVVASDSPSNPPGAALEATRVSQPVVVDNTPPTVKDLAAKVNAAAISVSGLAVDADRIVSIHYALDSQDDWVAVLPDDGIADSPQEKFSFEIKPAKEGPHRVAVKVEDIFGNVGYASVAATVGKQP